MNDETMKFGLLLESAQAHQKLVEDNLERLKAHTRDLDGLVREEIRRTLIEELQAVSAESRRAARALQDVRRVANRRTASFAIVMAILSAAIPGALAWWLLPSQGEITALRIKRDALASNVAQLEERGGRIDWRRCGDAGRLCVRVERQAPAFGAKADYLIVKGY